jgi:hypothetical protein
VSGSGDIANWCIPGKMMKGIGGAMDLCAGVKRIVVATTHCAKDGSSKIMRECTLPLTARAVVDTIITELAVFKVRPGQSLLLVEHNAGVSVEEIRSKTAADFEVSPDLAEMRFSPMNRKHAAGPPAAAAAAPKESSAEGRREGVPIERRMVLPVDHSPPVTLEKAPTTAAADSGVEIVRGEMPQQAHGQ